MLSMCSFTGLFLIISWRELMASVPRMSSWSVTVHCMIWEFTTPSSVVTVTSRSTEPEIGMTSIDADISGRVSSFWSVGIPIFFLVELDSMLHYALVSTKKGNLRLLMATATDGEGSLTSSVEGLMVDVVMRLTLDDHCLVLQAASMCPFLPKNCKQR